MQSLLLLQPQTNAKTTRGRYPAPAQVQWGMGHPRELQCQSCLYRCALCTAFSTCTSPITQSTQHSPTQQPFKAINMLSTNTAQRLRCNTGGKTPSRPTQHGISIHRCEVCPTHDKPAAPQPPTTRPAAYRVGAGNTTATPQQHHRITTQTRPRFLEPGEWWAHTSQMHTATAATYIT